MKYNQFDFPNDEAHLNFAIKEDKDKIIALCYALSNDIRYEILKQVHDGPKTAIELAKLNYIAMSTLVYHLQILEDASLIKVAYVNGIRGPVKVCYPSTHLIDIFISNNKEKDDSIKEVSYSMGVGQFVDASDKVDCSFADENKDYHAAWNNMYQKERFNAKLICLTNGYLTYAFPNDFAILYNVKEIAFSLEICSEIYYHNNNYKSDITFWINDIEILTWTCPGDFGDRRGRLTPSWWADASSQYGMLKAIKVNEYGVYLDDVLISSKVKISDLNLNNGNKVLFKVGNKEDSKYIGGFNIFGSCFGDHEQDIVLKVKYQEK